MSSTGKYRIFTALTREAKLQHQVLTARGSLAWPADLRADLEAELRELCTPVTHEEAEGEHKKTGKGEKGKASGGGHVKKKIAGEEDEPAHLETIALLLYRAEHETLPPATTTSHTNIGTPLAPPVAAATMLFDKAQKSAQLSEPILPPEQPATLSGEYIPSFERHAAVIGANVMYVRVHPSAIGLFKRELGYEAVGQMIIEKGVTLQAMRKIIGFQPPSPKEGPT